jgi:prepilin-type N-terminal cleavage/methylation domain-containing protein
MVTARSTRRGYTLFEMIVVMTILIILAAVVLPSLGAFRGNSRQRAAADSIRGELAVSRARAMEEGRPYRVAISEDGARIRRAPDDTNFSQNTPTTNCPDGSSSAVDYAFESPVTVQVVPDPNVVAPAPDNGWVTIATVQPDGTCREDTTLVSIKEDDLAPMYLRVRGLTGGSRVVPSTTVNGGAR